MLGTASHGVNESAVRGMPLGERIEQSSLADTGFTAHKHKLWSSQDCLLQTVLERRELGQATHHPRWRRGMQLSRYGLLDNVRSVWGDARPCLRRLRASRSAGRRGLEQSLDPIDKFLRGFAFVHGGPLKLAESVWHTCL